MLCFYLRDDRGDKKDRKNGRANEIAEVHRHRHGVAAGFTQGGRENFDNPENQRDFWHFAQCLLACHSNCSPCITCSKQFVLPGELVTDIRRQSWIGSIDIAQPAAGREQ